MAMRYDEQIVVRCSKKLKRAVDQWAKQNHANSSEVSRKVLEVAFGVAEDTMPLPPGLAHIQPGQVAPGKS